jgi:hypothetical protein
VLAWGLIAIDARTAAPDYIIPSSHFLLSLTNFPMSLPHPPTLPITLHCPIDIGYPPHWPCQWDSFYLHRPCLVDARNWPCHARLPFRLYRPCLTNATPPHGPCPVGFRSIHRLPMPASIFLRLLHCFVLTYAPLHFHLAQHFSLSSWST